MQFHICFLITQIIPESLSGRYFAKRRGSVILKTLDGKSWSSEYHTHTRHCYTRLQPRDWKTFVQDNKLKLSDVCVFELIEGTEITLKVSIFQVDESLKSSEESILKHPQFSGVIKHWNVRRMIGVVSLGDSSLKI